ncbi:hypothetical protein BaRGS_00036742 [Batillaria attramentaria]|uniref:Uncharacterized protein n=1 Tax=Batillaria attramentaria TaxID=370345 RepID=A0ABD0JAM6_9CAEN
MQFFFLCQLSFTSSVWNSIGKASSTLELQKGQKLKMVVTTSSSSSESEVAVTARLYNTVYLASQTGASRSEVQIFDFTSDVEQEVQHLVVTSSGQVNGRSEVQTLTVAGELSEYFVVGFHGAFTGPLTAQQTDSEALSGALNALPSMFGDEVTVTDTLSDTQRVYTITFPAARGNVAQLEAEPATNASGASPTVATKTEGESTLESFQLEFGGTVTKPIPPNASPAEVRSALKDSAGVRCPAAFRRGVSLMDCESASDCAGERVGHEEPFCGRFSARNPDRVYTRPNNDDWKGYSIDSNGKYVSS